MRSGIFVNYRVGDCEREAALLARILADKFGDDQVFFASRSIVPGQDYTEALPAGVRRSSVLLAVIGPQWLTVADGSGIPRIQRADDWVRQEIAIAIADGIRVIPVLMDGAHKVRLPEAGHLPADIRGLARCQYVRLSYQNMDVDRLVDELAAGNPELFAQGLLTTASQLPADFAPSMLLRAEYETVPFHGREAEEKDFDDWCDDGARLAVRLIVGPGGQGKTRLAKRLCERRAADGWVAGFVDEAANDAALSAIARVPGPVLLAFDYAESRIGQVRALAGELLRHERGGRQARLLLLTRAASEWTRELSAGSDDRLSMVFQAATEWRLAPLAATPAARRAEFASATAEFADRLGVPLDLTEPPDLDDPRYERALDVHAAALAALLDLAYAADPAEDRRPTEEAASAGPATDPVWRVLDHERRYWRRSLPRFGLPAEADDNVDALVAIATLYGAQTHADALRLTEATEPLSEATRAQRQAYLRWAGALYPGQASLNALRPDRLGEDHVAYALGRQPTLASGLLPHVGEPQLARALTVLGRAAPRHAIVRATLGGLLTDDLERLLPLGMTVATQLDNPGPLAAALIEAVRSHPVPEVASLVLDQLPDQSTALADLAVLASGITLENVERRAEINPRTTAHLLLRHAYHLRQAGRHRDGLSAADRAEQLFTQLAAQDQDAHLANLGRCAHTLSVIYSDLGQPADALAAINRAAAIRCKLADADAAYLPELALTLDVQSSDLAEFGEWEQSMVVREQSIDVFRRLASVHPGRYEPSLVTTLSNLAVLCKQLRRPVEGEAAASEAVPIARRLAEAYPDKYLASLATALNCLAAARSELRRPEEAGELVVEAVGLLRKLTDADHADAPAELASALINESVIFSQRGNVAESLAAAGEAVELYRQLTAEHPGRFESRLAMALNSYANRLSTQDRNDDALEAIDDVIAIRRQLAALRPNAERGPLAMAMANKAAFLARQRRWAESAEASRAAAGLYRELLPDEPSMIGPQLATTLDNLAAVTQLLDGVDEATAAITEAVALRRELMGKLPGLHAAPLTRSLLVAARIAAKAGDLAAARDFAREAVEIAQQVGDSKLIDSVTKAAQEL